MYFSYQSRITDVTYRSDSTRPAYLPEARYGMGHCYASTSYAGSNISSPAHSETSPMGPPAQEFPSPGSVGSPPPQMLPACVEQFNAAAGSPAMATDATTLPGELLQPGATGSLTLRTSASEQIIQGLVDNLLSDYHGQELDDVSMAQLNTNSFYAVPGPQSGAGETAGICSSPPMANGI